MDKVQIMKETYTHLEAARDGLKQLCQSSHGKWEKKGYLEDIQNIERAMISCNKEHQMYATTWYNVYNRFERLPVESKKKVIEILTGGKIFKAAEFNEFVEKYGNGDYFTVMKAVSNRSDITPAYNKFLWNEKNGYIRFFCRYESFAKDNEYFTEALLENDEALKILGYKEDKIAKLKEIVAIELKEWQLRK